MRGGYVERRVHLRRTTQQEATLPGKVRNYAT